MNFCSTVHNIRPSLPDCFHKSRVKKKKVPTIIVMVNYNDKVLFELIMKNKLLDLPLQSHRLDLGT
jgi:hypothetical protein